MPFTPPYDVYNLPDDAPLMDMQREVIAAMREVGVDATPSPLGGPHIWESAPFDSWELRVKAANLVRQRYGYRPFPDAETLRLANETST